MKQAGMVLLLLVLSSSTFAQYGINPPETAPVDSGSYGINPPNSAPEGSGSYGIGSFEAAQFEVEKLMKLSGDDLLDQKEALVEIARNEPQTLELFAEWNQYYRSEEFANKDDDQKTMEMIALKYALHHIATIGTGREFWGE